MPSLSDLSAELKLAIVESLNALHSDTTNYAPVTPFFPTPSKDMISLSCCYHALRSLIAPNLYPRVCLRNNDKSGGSLLAVADSPWADLVRELHFEGFATIGEKQPIPSSDKDFPTSVNKVLSHLKRFSKLNALTIRFMFGKTASEDEGAIYSFFFFY